MTLPLKALIALLGAALMLSGCSFDVYKLPLPGGVDVGSNPITVKAEFRDVLDLVPDSTVKVNDVTVGKITDISLKGYTAEVTMQLRNDTKLPDNAVATIQQTSLLGEKFVQLEPPAHDQLYMMWTGVPAPGAGFTYRLWAIRGDSVTYLGDFLPDNGVVALRIAVDPTTVDSLLITLESLGSPPSQPVESVQQAG